MLFACTAPTDMTSRVLSEPPLSHRGTRDRAKGAIAEPLDGGALTRR
jgi:hypothetical protein